MISTLLTILLLITLSPISIHAMENNQPTELLNQLRVIQQTLETEKNDFLEMVYNKHLDPAQELARIEQKFIYYRSKLINEENAHLLQLKKHHNISNDTWAKGMENLDNTKMSIKNHINTSLRQTRHDTIISGENKIFFAKQLKKYDLDLQKINIKKTDDLGDKIPPFVRIERNEYKNTSTPLANKPKITISSPLFTSISPINQKANLAILAWMMGNICTISSAFIDFIIHTSNKECTFESFEKSKDYRSLFALQQNKCADIFPCLEDYETCQCIESLRSRTFKPFDTPENQKDSFQQICTIKNLWEKRIILEDLLQK